jgi:hypothetical protein
MLVEAKVPAQAKEEHHSNSLVRCFNLLLGIKQPEEKKNSGCLKAYACQKGWRVDRETSEGWSSYICLLIQIDSYMQNYFLIAVRMASTEAHLRVVVYRGQQINEEF